MSEADKAIPTLRRAEVSTTISRIIFPGILSVTPIAAVSLFTAHYYVCLFSVISALALFAYPLLAFAKPGTRIWTLFFVNSCCLVPYFLICYLCFYKGIWGGFLLFSHFSWKALTVALGSIWLGWILVNATYQATEFVAAVAEGRLKLE